MVQSGAHTIDQDEESRQHILHWLDFCNQPQGLDVLTTLPQREQQQNSELYKSTPSSTRQSISSGRIWSENNRQKRKRKMAAYDSDSVQSGSSMATRTTALSLSEHNILPQPRTKSTRARSASPHRRTLADLRFAKPSIQVLQPHSSIVQPPAVVQLRNRLTKKLCTGYIPATLRERLRTLDPDLMWHRTPKDELLMVAGRLYLDRYTDIEAAMDPLSLCINNTSVSSTEPQVVPNKCLNDLPLVPK